MVAYAGAKKRIVIVGGGFGGAYAAQALAKKAPRDTEVVLIDRQNFLLFYPLLIEAGVGNLEPRHVTVPIRKFLGKKAKFVMADVQKMDLQNQQVVYQVAGLDEPGQVHYDHLILAPGSITKRPPIPGLAEHAFELKSLRDSIEFRDRGIRLLEMANTIDDDEERKALLRIVIVGSNFTGIELAGEYQEFLVEQAENYPNLEPGDVQVVIVEHNERILPAIDADLALFARRHLEKRGLVIHTKTTLTEVGADYVILTTGQKLRTHTTVWCAGIAPSPLIQKAPGLPTNERGYIVCDRTTKVQGFENVWAVGDSAFIPDPNGKPYVPTAQNSSRQGPLSAENVLRSIRGEELKTFDFNALGSLAALGRRSAVARVLGMKFSGFIAWFMFRTVYLMKMPSWSRKVRIVIDWTLSLFFKQEPVQLGVRER
jgi:NADH:ubiquinone reductase (H+-translocating)